MIRLIVYSNMAAAIITVVEITKIGGTPDFTCKSLQVHLFILSTWSNRSIFRWVYHRRHMGHVSSSRWSTIWSVRGGKLTTNFRIQTYLAITVASIPFIKPLFRDSNLFNLKFYQSLLAKNSFRTHTSRHRSRFATFKRGYTMQKDDRTCGSPGPLSPINESFIITALPSVKFDSSNRNNNLREAHEFSLA